MPFPATTTLAGDATTTDADAVAAAVTALGPLDREALLLRSRGRTIDEVAAATGTTPAMVRVRLHRAATAVERRVGSLPMDGTRVVFDRDRPLDEVLADAEVGITPILHARLTAALDRTREPARPRFRRTAALVQSITERAPQLTSLASIVWLVGTGVAALTGAV